MALPPPALTLTGLTKRFGSKTAVDDISLDIRDGEFFTIVGPSGSGKSSLVRLLAGLDTPTTGRLHLRGTDITEVPANRRPTAMVFQSLALFDHRSVGQNIEFAMKMKGVPQAERRARALDLLRLVRLPEDYYPRPVTQCSGGERQRVALARALGSDPEILFFDEPLSAIDYRLRKTLEVELKELHQRTGKTFIYITHSLEEAMVMSDRIAIMRTGRFEQIGTPDEIYRRPNSRFVASFMGEVNILEISRTKGTPHFADLDLPAPQAPGAFAVLRPEALSPGAGEGPSFDALVTQKLMLGSRTQFHLRAGNTALIAEVAAGPRSALEVGQTARFGFDPADIAWVDS
ncbi:ABC transporter ATP-binding protein [Pseudotabrizicola algicola]|uniref:ABC transporter ATP-binding protein n=1 Tax=Pseudotabrizicola algicola TaxID=2709381 RepID=A0A6B3RKZ2_9RHOB|nr:ABC transporter ATP-binding protein [Pseudotabrizicola algicola]NEX46710.1 ABC transporter ATP-binding protein [Pseudotabrizicola algicola]